VPVILVGPRARAPSLTATDESACTPGSVLGAETPRCGHPSRPTVAGRL